MRPVSWFVQPLQATVKTTATFSINPAFGLSGSFNPRFADYAAPSTIAPSDVHDANTMQAYFICLNCNPPLQGK
jgi:hypothetical protein